jgi:hypothetical protein
MPKRHSSRSLSGQPATKKIKRNSGYMSWEAVTAPLAVFAMGVAPKKSYKGKAKRPKKGGATKKNRMQKKRGMTRRR